MATDRRDFLKKVGAVGAGMVAFSSGVRAQAAPRVAGFPDGEAIAGFNYAGALVVAGSDEASRQGAEEFARAIKAKTGKEATIKRDREVTDQDKDSFELIVTGNSKSNTLIATMEKSLHKELVVTATHPGAGSGLIGVAYNPFLGSAKDALLVTGPDAAGIRAASQALGEIMIDKRPAISFPPLRERSVVKYSIVPGIASPTQWAFVDAGFVDEELRYYNSRLEVVNLLGAPQHVEALVAGSVQIANPGGNNSLLEARAKGIPVKIIGATAWWKYPDHPQMGLIVKKDSPVQGFKDLVGKKVATNALRNVFNFMLDEALLKEGIDPKRVELIEVPILGTIGALQGGQVDAAITTVPIIMPGVLRFGVQVVAWDFDVREKGILASYVTTDDYLAKNFDLVVAFLKAAIKGRRWVTGHLEEAVALVPKRVKGIPLEAVRATAPSTYQVSDLAVPGDRDLFVDSIREDIFWAKKAGYVPANVDEEKLLKEVVDTRPLKQAMAELSITGPFLWAPGRLSQPGPWAGLRSKHEKLWK